MAETIDAIVMAEGSEFALISCDGGASYRLNCKEEKSSAHVQGEDLPGFLSEYESIKAQYPSYSIDQVLAQLWDQGGYCWMAVSDEV